jgi:hypothetical protein
VIYTIIRILITTRVGEKMFKKIKKFFASDSDTLETAKEKYRKHAEEEEKNAQEKKKNEKIQRKRIKEFVEKLNSDEVLKQLLADSDEDIELAKHEYFNECVIGDEWDSYTEFVHRTSRVYMTRTGVGTYPTRRWSDDTANKMTDLLMRYSGDASKIEKSFNKGLARIIKSVPKIK